MGIRSYNLLYSRNLLKNKTTKNVYGETVPREKIFKVLSSEEISRELDKNDKEPEVKIVEKIVEVPVEVEKEVIGEKYIKLPGELRGPFSEALKHAKRQGLKTNIDSSQFFN